MQLSTFLSIVLVSAPIAVGSETSGKVREDFERTIPFDNGGNFELQNRNGSITVKTWSESSVRIEAEKVAKTEAHLDDIEIQIEGSGDTVSVRTVHHRKRDGGGVSYIITLPEQANVDVRTANGAVTIEGIHGRVEARSTNGSLKVEDIVGEVEAATTNGSIRARYQRPSDGRHRFHTTNGSVRVYLPSDAGGEVEAETVNGSIDIDFPTNLTRVSRRHVRGSFGNGGGSYEIETVNGSVKIVEN